jgi:hypothetical protein
MRVQQIVWNSRSGWTAAKSELGTASLVIYFGTRDALGCGKRYDELRDRFPMAHILGCSTGGQINNNDVNDDEIVAAAISFDATQLRMCREEVSGPGRSHECGAAIGRALQADNLASVFVLSDGLNVNGSALVAGLCSVIGPGIPLTGGLAGDGAEFKETIVGADCAPRSHTIAAIGFYGSAIRIGHGSAGGWDQFGPRRQVTKSVGNILFELDGQPALDLYERYLGPEESQGLPGSALLFPIQVYDAQRPNSAVVRTVLAIDRAARSMTFAGDVPQGWTAQLMRGNLDRLTAGAADAARQARAGLAADDPGAHGRMGRVLAGQDSDQRFSILVSCIGRRLLMGQRTLDEVEAVGAELGPESFRFGFYSYGEISPHATSGHCELHNQTMTITTLAEVA